MTSLCKKTKTITFRMTREDYDKYLSLFEIAKTRKDKRYTISDFIRDAIFNKEIRNIKIVKTKSPTKCQKNRLQMLIPTIINIESIAKALITHRKNHNFNLNEYLLKINETNSILKGELS